MNIYFFFLDIFLFDEQLYKMAEDLINYEK